MTGASSSHYSGAEKRRFRRLIKQFIVRIQIQGGYSRDWDMVLIQNISRGGLLFSTSTELKAGMLLNFKINIALNKNTISCVGKVIRVRAIGDPPLYEAGISFTEMKEDDAELMNNIIEDYLARNPDNK